MSTMFALSLTPVIFLIGVSVDYSRANRTGVMLQDAIDSATLGGAFVSATNRESIASNVFTSNASTIGGSGTTATFSTTAEYYQGVATTTIPTTFLKAVSINSITVSKTARVTFGSAVFACVVALGTGLDVNTNAITFNGSPSVNLDGCSLRSNKSMTCNGHNTNSTGAYAVGTVTNCANAHSNNSAQNDIYNALKSNISTTCSSTFNDAIYNTTWSAGSSLGGAYVTSSTSSAYDTYHVCGNLTLSGTGSLYNSTSKDMVVYVENGSINVTNGAALTANRITFILAGSDTATIATKKSGNGAGAGNTTYSSTTPGHTIDFPNGAGQAASLTLSPSTASTNPWKGIAVFQDPNLTSSIDATWSSGASLYVDGIVYMPNSNVTASGNFASGVGACTSIITKTFSGNGNISLKESQTACDALNVSYPKTDPHISY
jgi:hypothetical protein